LRHATDHFLGSAVHGLALRDDPRDGEPGVSRPRRLARQALLPRVGGGMAFADLREFIAHLEKHGQLRRIAVPVSRDLEIPEITDRVSKSSGTRNVALLFENVHGFSVPVLINAFGSAERMAAALGVERIDDLGARVAKLLDLKMPGSFFDKLKKLGTLFDVAKA